MNLDKTQLIAIYITIGVTLTILSYIAINTAVSRIIIEFLNSDKLKQAVQRKLQQLNYFNQNDKQDYHRCTGQWGETDKGRMAASHVKITKLLEHLKTVDSSTVLGGLSFTLTDIRKRAEQKLEGSTKFAYRSVEFISDDDYNKIIACMYPAVPDQFAAFLTLRVFFWPLTLAASVVRLLAGLLRWLISKCVKSPFKD